ncbi:MAG: DISARM system SNF2-like helicase DrmD [Leptolyngbya sp. UWPOB_LEPTO1]|uniref:DISARM system SNF2-like helicase DrmD n=1 Tax=Leptolyngbya sp. UWPOB_LEPTO1 TaxID=2815653 RepID=UPI001AD0152B|nr:DISARM system SNF2-like helicase DrmD [Leptolyngbya sp. UWPOB_LEPTO1]MBN8564083.1 DISARM system SNF2-like helicase DrmD [Leptolyngbya sp. UWPOB_LEPTO1]
MSAIKAIPEQGQLVKVRQRLYVVTDVRQTTLPAGVLLSNVTPAQHLVLLSSIEDDGLGEELQVIWELEPGTQVFERVELPKPTGFDDPARLDAFLDAVRWGAASSADIRTLQAPFRSGIDIEDYQLDPVVRAIQMPRVNLLIADDVGLGKTIEAGLVAQELLIRHRCRRMLIICPSSLQIQWRDQMRDKFGLDFRIVDSNLMKDLRRQRGIHVNPWIHFPRLITSIDFLKRDRPLRLFREVLPAEGESIYPRRFDLLIVDEAHNVAPSGSGQYAIDSQRTATIRLLVPHFEHKLFLTATPHNGYPESFTALLELLDTQRFARGVEPDRNQLQVVMVRRLKQEMQNWDGSPMFPGRKLEAIAVDYPQPERQVHASLKRYTELRTKGVDDNVEKYATEFVLKLLKKRLFSSPEAFLTTLTQHQESLTTARRRQASRLSAKPTEGILRRQLEQVEEDFADDELYEAATDESISNTSRLFRALTPEEQDLLREMLQWAETAARQPDAKAAELLNWINTVICPNGQWLNERVIIFTEYRATQKWLYNLMASEGLVQGDRLMMLYGGMNSDDREAVKAAFQAHPDVSSVRILLATDAASEGLDLQNFCSRLIHYEIPWNPNRMEQRNGRIDRHGQRSSEVRIYHFVGKDYQEQSTSGIRPGDLEGDLEFLMRAALKVNNIREDLGKVGPVIASQVEEAMLGRRVTLDTSRAERESEPVRRMLKFERKVRDQIEKLRDQLQETRQNLRLTPENIEAVVRIGLELADQPPLIEAEIEGLQGRAFYLPQLKSSWAACAEGLEHPHTKEIRPIVFDPNTAHGRDDVVLAHLNHRLVQMCLRLLRAEVWSTEGRKQLHRVAARVVSSQSGLETPAVVAYGRLVILGSDQQRLHEEVIVAGGELKEGRFNRLGVMKLQAALGNVSGQAVPEAMQQKLAQMWDKCESSLMQALEVRKADRSTSLRQDLQNRAEKEIADITAVLTELQKSILAELQEPQVEQLEIFSNPEREQFERNVNSLKARLEQIPIEIEQETALIRKRFENPTARLFPLAVTFLVPQKLIRP